MSYTQVKHLYTFSFRDDPETDLVTGRWVWTEGGLDYQVELLHFRHMEDNTLYIISKELI